MKAGAVALALALVVGMVAAGWVFGRFGERLMGWLLDSMSWRLP